MSCIINASTSAGLVQSADTSGNLQLQWNGQAAPAFSAYLGNAQAVSGATYTKVAINTEEFDTNSNFDTTNYRFTPTVAGYYQVNGAIGYTASNITNLVTIYKNGVEFKRGQYTNTSNFCANVSALIYLNGTTDYVELYVYSGAVTYSASAFLTYFQAVMVRGA